MPASTFYVISRAVILLLITTQQSNNRVLACEPIPCRWGHWSTWSECYGANCGGKYSIRNRNRSYLKPKCGGDPKCEGHSHEEEPCRGTECYNGGQLDTNWTCICQFGYAGDCCGERTDMSLAKLISAMCVVLLCLCCLIVSLIACDVDKRERIQQLRREAEENNPELAAANARNKKGANCCAEMFQI